MIFNKTALFLLKNLSKPPIIPNFFSFSPNFFHSFSFVNTTPLSNQRNPYKQTYPPADILAKLLKFESFNSQKDLLIYLKESLGYLSYCHQYYPNNKEIIALKNPIKKAVFSIKFPDKFPNILPIILRNYLDFFNELDPEYLDLLFTMIRNSGYLNEFALLSAFNVFSRTNYQNKELWILMNSLVKKHEKNDFEVLSIDTLLSIFSSYTLINTKDSKEIPLRIFLAILARSTHFSAKNMAIFMQTLVKFPFFMENYGKLEEILIVFLSKKPEIKPRDLTMIIWSVTKSDNIKGVLIKLLIDKLDSIKNEYSHPHDLVLTMNSLIKFQKNKEFITIINGIIGCFVPIFDRFFENGINNQDLYGFLNFLCKNNCKIEEKILEKYFQVFLKTHHNQNHKFIGFFLLCFRQKNPIILDKFSDFIINQILLKKITINSENSGSICLAFAEEKHEEFWQFIAGNFDQFFLDKKLQFVQYYHLFTAIERRKMITKQRLAIIIDVFAGILRESPNCSIKGQIIGIGSHFLALKAICAEETTKFINEISKIISDERVMMKINTWDFFNFLKGVSEKESLLKGYVRIGGRGYRRGVIEEMKEYVEKEKGGLEDLKRVIYNFKGD